MCCRMVGEGDGPAASRPPKHEPDRNANVLVHHSHTSQFPSSMGRLASYYVFRQEPSCRLVRGVRRCPWVPKAARTEPRTSSLHSGLAPEHPPSSLLLCSFGQPRGAGDIRKRRRRGLHVQVCANVASLPFFSKSPPLTSLVVLIGDRPRTSYCT